VSLHIDSRPKFPLTLRLSFFHVLFETQKGLPSFKLKYCRCDKGINLRLLSLSEWLAALRHFWHHIAIDTRELYIIQQCFFSVHNFFEIIKLLGVSSFLDFVIFVDDYFEWCA